MTGQTAEGTLAEEENKRCEERKVEETKERTAVKALNSRLHHSVRSSGDKDRGSLSPAHRGQRITVSEKRRKRG